MLRSFHYTVGHSLKSDLTIGYNRRRACGYLLRSTMRRSCYDYYYQGSPIYYIHHDWVETTIYYEASSTTRPLLPVYRRDWWLNRLLQCQLQGDPAGLSLQASLPGLSSLLNRLGPLWTAVFYYDYCYRGSLLDLLSRGEPIKRRFYHATSQ